MENFRSNSKKDIQITQLNPGGDRQDGIHIARESLSLDFSPENQEKIRQKSIVVDLCSSVEENKPSLELALKQKPPLILTGSELTFSQKEEDKKAKPEMSDYYRRAELYTLRAIGYARRYGGRVLGVCFGFQSIAKELFSTNNKSCVQPLNQWVAGESLIDIDDSWEGIIKPGKYQIRLSLKDAVIRKSWSPSNELGIENISNEFMEVKVLGEGPEVILPSTGENVSLVMGYRVKFKKSGGEILALAGHPELPMSMLNQVIKQRSSDSRFNMPLNLLKLDDEDRKNSMQSIEIVSSFLSNNES
ncbi:MAG: hypothetical protein AAGF07_04615 [Patescibacteria group bacterium]